MDGPLLVLGLKEGLVECATVCVKSVVILKDSNEFIICPDYIYRVRIRVRIKKIVKPKNIIGT